MPRSAASCRRAVVLVTRSASARAIAAAATLGLALGLGLALVPAAGAWPHVFADEIHSSPMVADIHGDGIPEVIVLTADDMLNVLGPDDSPTAGWPRSLGPASQIPDGQNWVSGSAAVVDLEGDGSIEILQVSFDGKLHALSATGIEKPGFPISMGSYSADTPTVADLDGDHQLEILCRYNPGSIGVWSRTGQMLPGWPRPITNAPGGAIDVWSCPAIADLDGDGEMEIVAGDYDGYCRAFHRDGSTVAGWPVDVNIMNTYPGWCLSSPATADLDGDGRDEVVIGSDDDRLFVIQGDGTFFPGWPRVIPFGFRASPALGDLDGDGDLEIVIGHRTSAGDLRLYALHHDGSMVSGWPVAQAAGGGGYTFGWLSPVLADLTGDGRPEVIAVKERRVANPDQAEIWAFGPNGGAALPGFPISLEGLAYGMPVIDDFDRDGLAEILIGDLTRRLYKFDLSQPIIADREPFEWRRLQKDLVHTGRFVVRNPEGNEEGRDLGGSGRPAAWVAAPNPFVDQVRLMPAGRGENGSGGETGIGIGNGTGATGGWTVLDAQGRRVRALRGSRPVWDGRNDAGHAAAPGIYFAYPDGSGGTRGFVRLLKLR